MSPGARWTQADLDVLQPAGLPALELAGGPRRSKYGVRLDAPGRLARTHGGLVFASALEAERYDELEALRTSGDVFGYTRQPRWVLTPGSATARPTVYVADFLVLWRGLDAPRWRGEAIPRDAAMGSITVEDVKGARTTAYLRAIRQMASVWPHIVICELTRDSARRAGS